MTLRSASVEGACQRSGAHDVPHDVGSKETDAKDDEWPRMTEASNRKVEARNPNSGDPP